LDRPGARVLGGGIFFAVIRDDSAAGRELNIGAAILESA
jgi:hypothetical protein